MKQYWNYDKNLIPNCDFACESQDDTVFIMFRDGKIFVHETRKQKSLKETPSSNPHEQKAEGRSPTA